MPEQPPAARATPPTAGAPSWAGLAGALGHRSVRRVELKMLLDPGQDLYELAGRVGLDPARAESVRVRYFDDRDHSLSHQGVTIRVRESGRRAELGLKLRSARPVELPPALRRLPGLMSELDALPDRSHWSLAIKSTVVRTRRSAPVDHWLELCSPEQRAFLAAITGRASLARYDATYGPAMATRLVGSTQDLGRLMLERWQLPEGRELVELSTKCRPRHARSTATAIRTLVHARAVIPSALQRTKTEECLRTYLVPAPAG